MKSPETLYRSQAGYEAIQAWYQQALDRLPIPHTTMNVSTRHGATHVIVTGQQGRPPIVLLHALSANALMWRAQIPSLSKEFRVYTPDIIGMAGRSAPTRPPYEGHGHAEWIVDVLDGLEIQQASFVGIAFGAWLTIKAGGFTPERIHRAALLAPAGLLPLRWGYLIPTLMKLLVFGRWRPRQLARDMLSPPDLPVDEDLVTFLSLILKHFRSPFEAPALPPREIQKLTAPTLVLVGERENVWDPDALLAKARQLLPGIESAEIVSEAGHALIANRPEMINRRLSAFLRGDAGRSKKAPG
jgi:pimeloyl-ACP methyl ester carboxylesterase